MTTPKHNQWDNIWEIRQKGYLTQQLLEEALSKPSCFTDKRVIGRAAIFQDVRHFIYTVTHSSRISLPIWKLLIPRLDNHNVGAIYYIVKTPKCNLVFRATYGYCGTGPHQAALIEACFEKLGLFFETRDGDFMLTFLESSYE